VGSPFDSLEVRGTVHDDTASPPEYPLTSENEVAYLSANGMRLARLHYEPPAKGEPRLETSGALHAANLHVFLNLPDHLGSSSLIVDRATGELVEARTYQPFGATESDYRPERWKGFREDYGFTGKEEDVEVGLTYFGKRFLSPYLGRWISADPLAVHVPGEADLNLYAYVQGATLRLVDPMGLDPKDGSGGQSSASPEENREGAAGTDEQSRDGSGGEEVAEAVLDAMTVGAAATNLVSAASLLCGDSPCKNADGTPAQADPALALSLGAAVSGGSRLAGALRRPNPQPAPKPEKISADETAYLHRQLAKIEEATAKWSKGTSPQTAAESTSPQTAAEASPKAARAVAPSSRALGRALEAAGHVRPPGSAAHHIVAGGAQKAGPARAALEKFGIGINDAANGAFLPSSVHARIHTNAYYDAVNTALQKATTREEALGALNAIRQGLVGGGFP
jgi:RHS repeat-associated protein